MPRILILEPYLPTAQAIEVILKRAGWEVTLSQTAQETLKALQHDCYDALLVDLDATTGDGWHLLQSLHPSPHSVPIIALLGLDRTQQPRAHALGVCIVLPNPIDRETLLSGATAVLEQV